MIQPLQPFAHFQPFLLMLMRLPSVSFPRGSARVRLQLLLSLAGAVISVAQIWASATADVD